MSEFTEDAKSGHHDYILKSIVERSSVLVEARVAAASYADFSYPVLAGLMIAAEVRELGEEVRQLTRALEALGDTVALK